MDTAVRTDDRSGSIDREAVGLAAVDVALVAGLLVGGQISHGVNPLEEPLATVETIAPFAIGWIVVALIAGLYASRAASSVTRAARETSIAWLAAANVGLLLRQSRVFGETANWPFPLVITGFGFLLLVGWRVGYAALSSRRS